MIRALPLNKFNFWIESLNHRIKVLGYNTKVNAPSFIIKQGEILSVNFVDQKETYTFKAE